MDTVRLGRRGFLPTVLLLLFLSLFPLRAQNDTIRLSHAVSGAVTDAADNKPLEGVNVSTPDGFYTVTNADGFFSLKSDRPIGRVTFFFPGYHSRSVLPEDFAGGRMTVQMTPVTYLLKESRVIDGDPRAIVEEAVDRIPKNYPVVTEYHDCFYRETVRKRQRYIDISEAVTLLQKRTYANLDNWGDRVAVRVGRRLVSPRRSDTLGVRVLGGPVQAVGLDMVKCRDILLDREELGRYALEMMPPVPVDGRMHFVIRLSPRDLLCPYPLYYGVLYIDRETLAFTRMELSLDMSDKYKATQMMLVSKPPRLRFTPKEQTLVVSYVPDPADGLYRLRYMRTTFRFQCDWKKRLFSTSFTVVNEMVATHRRTTESAVSRKEAFPPGASLTEQMGYFEDPDFWKDYNIIEPTESLEHAIGRLKKK